MSEIWMRTGFSWTPIYREWCEWVAINYERFEADEDAGWVLIRDLMLAGF